MKCRGGCDVPDRLKLCEAHLQVQLRRELDRNGWTVHVIHDSTHSPKGWPDIFAVRLCLCVQPCDDTEAVAIELKSEKGKVSAEQEAWLDLLRWLPGVKFAGVIRPSSWFAGELDDVLR